MVRSKSTLNQGGYGSTHDNIHQFTR